MTDRLSADLATLRIDRSQQGRSSGGGGLRWLVALLLLGGLAAAGWFFVVPSLRSRASRVDIEVAEITLLSSGPANSVDLSAAGFVVPQRLVKLGSRVPGRIEKVFVREGERVKAGQTLFELEAGSRRSALQASQARVSAARARTGTARANMQEIQQQLERQQRLASSGAVSQSSVDDLKSRVAVLQAQVQAADAEANAVSAEARTLEVELQQLVVVSPIDGKAINKPKAVGDVATLETTLVELADFSSLVLEVDIPEAKIGSIAEGRPCEVVLDAFAGRRLRAVVTEVNPRINRAKGTGTVKVKLFEGEDIALPDMAGRVSFLSAPMPKEADLEKPKKIVPASSVVERNGAKVVFVIERERARSVPVTIGAPSGGGFELVEGPAVGTKIVRAPSAELQDGTTVRDKSAGG